MANSARNKPGEEKITDIQELKGLDNLMSMYENNKKRINTISTVVLGVIVAFVAYQKLYQAPRAEKAATAIAFAQRYFEVDSLDKAMNGDGQHQGFVKIEKKYSGTPTANLCHYYMGVCYLRKGDFKNAIKHLEDFDGNGTQVAYAAWGAIGDAYMETGNKKKGIEYYEKATGDKDNTLYTPLYLYRLGVAYELDGKLDEAKKAYTRVRDEYPQSQEARDMDKYLARLGVVE